MTDQLLPCPFCGKQPRYVTGCYVDTQGNDLPFAECDPCHVGAPVEFWNTRAQPADCDPKPVAIVCGSSVQWLPGAGSLKDRTELFTHPAPAGVVLSMAQVMQAYEKVPGHLIPGSSNWCAAMATRLNACREETARLNGVRP